MKKRVQIKTSRGKVTVHDRLKNLNKTERHAVLATVFQNKPYTSIVAYTLTKDSRGAIFATPKNTRKYKNLERNKNVALLIDNRKNTDKDYMGAESVTIIGYAKSIRRGKHWLELSRLLIKKHPALREFVRSRSTALILIEAKHCLHVSQFQTISEWKIK